MDSSKLRRATGGWRTLFFSLRVRLLVLVAVAIAPLLAERIRALEVGREDRIKLAELQVLDLARQGADAQDDLLSSARAIVQTVALADVIKNPESDACPRYLGEVGRSSALDYLSVATAGGIVRCSNRDELVGANLSGRNFFQQTIATKSFVVSEYLIGRSMGQPLIAVAWPKLSASGDIEAVVVATLNLSWIDRLVAALSQKTRATAFIVDQAGTLVSRYPAIGTAVDQDYAQHPLVETVIRDSHGTTRQRGLDGRHSVFGFVRLQQGNTWLAVGIDEAQLLGSLNRQTMYLYLTLLAVTALILLGVWWGGEQFVIKPIRQFAMRAMRLGYGRFEPQQPFSAVPTEFKPLNRALDRMARKLAVRESELHKANKQLNRLAQTDALTGLQNRRRFDARLGSTWAVHASKCVPIACLMLDVDWFKAFNDRYGHVAGDTCLRAVAEVISTVARSWPEGSAARYGGEEFAVLLPGATADEAQKIAEQIRLAVAALAIPHEAAPLGKVTICAGVAHSLPALGCAPQDLVEMADAALYEAKSLGRNIVVVAPVLQLSLAG